MLLAIDIGNTNSVFALCHHQADDSAETIIHSWRCKTDAQRTGDEYLSWLYPLFQRQDVDMNAITSVIISSVVPDANFNIRTFCKELLAVEPVFVGKDIIDMEITLPNPDEVGADRLVNALAARERYGAPAIIIDFGTATTFDVVDKDGRYCGGVISPGINLSLDALHKAAARLPQIHIAKPKAVIGTDTVSAMQSGVYWGYVGLISGILDGLKAEIEGDPKIIATGGLADMFLEAVPAIQTVDKSLTLDGLLYINRTARSR